MAACTPQWKKDPTDVLNFTFDWTNWLAGDGITSASFTVNGADSTISIVDQSFSSNKATVLISGGTKGYTYVIISRITTVGGLSESSLKTILIKP